MRKCENKKGGNWEEQGFRPANFSRAFFFRVFHTVGHTIGEPKTGYWVAEAEENTVNDRNKRPGRLFNFRVPSKGV